jgi:hypothetical protein
MGQFSAIAVSDDAMNFIPIHLRSQHRNCRQGRGNPAPTDASVPFFFQIGIKIME